MFLAMVFALIIAVVLAVSPAGRVAAFKAKWYLKGIIFMIRAKDLPSRYRGTNCIRVPNATAKYTNNCRTVRVVFIRHGQSVWNALFNSFNLGWPVRMVKAVVREVLDFFLNPFGSVIIDSPLSSKGKKEAQELSAYVRSAKDKISSDTRTSVIVSSNLRRAMETALVGLAPRVSVTHERMVVDSTLQEGSQNIDAQSFSTEKGKLAPMLIGNLTKPEQLADYFNPALNAGNKTAGKDVYDRMDDFIHHLFGDSADSLVPAAGRSNAELREVIVVGHSGYFRNFFRRFLPESSKHVSKKSKMQNCAAVAFELTHNKTTGEVSIDESSIQVLYRGFK